MKIACVYHSVDLDGWMSAAIVTLWWEKLPIGNERNELDMYGWKYGDSIPRLDSYDTVVMCDVSFPKEDMLKLWGTKGLNFIWIDHHISAIKDMENAYENISSGLYPIIGLRDTKFAACELTWKYFFTDEPMPEIVRLLGRYDCFGHKGTPEEQKVLEFQYGARQCITNYEEAYENLIYNLKERDFYEILDEDYKESIYKNGKTIYQYLCTEAKQTYKKGFEIKFTVPHTEYIGDGQYKLLRFICINKERFNPINFGINYHKDGYDGVACFWYENGKWNFSLYNDNGEVDCSQIAKQYGGGGHKGAAGFVCGMNEFTRIII